MSDELVVLPSTSTPLSPHSEVWEAGGVVSEERVSVGRGVVWSNKLSWLCKSTNLVLYTSTLDGEETGDGVVVDSLGVSKLPPRMWPFLMVVCVRGEQKGGGG
jgi:hypothetical protein